MKKTIFHILLLSCLLVGLTGCGASTTSGSTSGNNDPNLNDSTTDTNTNDVGNAADDVADNVGNAAEDIVDGVGNAVDDLVGGNGFNNYSDAHDYFLETMGNYHTDANFELRNESKDLFDYQEGSKGYRFHLYDTASGSDDMFGEFYVDANSGLIYRVENDGTIKEYPAKNNNNSNNNNNNNSNNNNNNNSNNNNQSGKNNGNKNTKTSTSQNK